MTGGSEGGASRHGARRRALFVAASLGAGVLVLLVLELGLRAVGLGGRPPLFVPAPDRPGWLQANPDVIERYAPASLDLGVAIEPIPFRETRPEGVYRIVVQGGSTAAGFPYGRWGGLAGMLGDRLEAELPGHEIEVVTTAMAAVNSNTLVDLVEEIIAIEPDAVLVYAGHNEYVGVLGVASALTGAPEEQQLSLTLRQVGLYRLVERLVGGAVRGFAGDGGALPLFERAARAARVPFGSPAYERGIEQLDRNLDALLRRYGEAGVPVYVGTLASNLRDLPPFVPGPRPETDAARWEAARERATELLGGDPLAARRALDEWVALDPQAAGAWFALARHLDARGDRDGAWAAFSRARDLDALRFRAPAAFNARIRALAARHGARLVEVEERFREASRGGVPGDDLLLEHVHPNALGYFLLADAFCDALAADGRIGTWPADDEARARRDMPITALDRTLADWDAARMRAGFPFRDPPEEVPPPVPRTPVERLALELRDGAISWLDAMESLMQLQLRAGRKHEAVVTARIVAQAYPDEAAPNRAAGLLLLELGNPARAVRYLERAVHAAPDDPQLRAALARARRDSEKRALAAPPGRP